MRKALSVLFVLTFAVRSLLPAGFMLAPAQAGAGKMTVVICTGHGAETMLVDEDGNPAPAEKPGGEAPRSSICPYALFGLFSHPAAAPVTLEGVAQYAALTYRVATEALIARPSTGAVSARGPPALQA